MASSVTYRQITFRLLPEKRSTWRRLDAMLDAQRRLYNAALEERDRVLSEDREDAYLLRSGEVPDPVP